jgi:hypothetical protein
MPCGVLDYLGENSWSQELTILEHGLTCRLGRHLSIATLVSNKIGLLP